MEQMFKENLLFAWLFLPWRKASEEEKQDINFSMVYILADRGKREMAEVDIERKQTIEE